MNNLTPNGTVDAMGLSRSESPYKKLWNSFRDITTNEDGSKGPLSKRLLIYGIGLIGTAIAFMFITVMHLVEYFFYFIYVGGAFVGKQLRRRNSRVNDAY